MPQHTGKRGIASGIRDDVKKKKKKKKDEEGKRSKRIKKIQTLMDRLKKK